MNVKMSIETLQVLQVLMYSMVSRECFRPKQKCYYFMISEPSVVHFEIVLIPTAVVVLKVKFKFRKKCLKLLVNAKNWTGSSARA